MLAQRYDKTDKGREEIAHGRKNLRGKIRTVLFLVDGEKLRLNTAAKPALAAK